MKDRKHAIRPVHLLAVVVAAVWVAGAVGCETSDPREEKKIVVPSAATSTPAYEGDGSIPEQRYVIRMSDGKRDWEVEFPNNASAYEMQIPLESEQQQKDPMRWEGEQLTEADKELLEHLRRQNPETESEGPYKDGENLATRDDEGEEGPDSAESEGESGGSKEKSRSGDEPAPTRSSYLLGLERVRSLYRKGKYELAMVRLKRLEEDYPEDVKILSMKGTLWLKLGRPALARRAWERVLEIDPGNRQVNQAIERIDESDEQSDDQSNDNEQTQPE